MFGVDLYSAELLFPSLVGIVGISAVMVWAAFKIRSLMNEEPKK